MTSIVATIFAYAPAEWLTYTLGAFIIAVMFTILYETAERSSLAAVALLMVWFPIEAVVLKYTPEDWYTLVKYAPEMLIYTAALVSGIRYYEKHGRLVPASPLHGPLVAFLAIGAISLIVNQYSVVTWMFGLRQTLRFVAVYYIIITHDISFLTARQLVRGGLVVGLAQALIAIVQWGARGHLDSYLFSTRTVAVGDMAVVGGLEQFWTEGTRVFATMGRYDQLGSFLALTLICLFAYHYTLRDEQSKQRSRIALGVVGVALILTASRASWLAAATGLVVIGIVLMRDRIFAHRLALAVTGLVLYLGVFALSVNNVSAISDNPTQQTLAERVYEAVSLESWRGSYEGYGRIFFIINTPRVVVAEAPLFGVGPGNYGGGAAAALVNTETYDRLHLPFGIENRFGQIDNSWFSLWGEVGTLGVLAWITILAAIIRAAWYVVTSSRDIYEQALARALIGVTAGIAVMGFFGPYFEFRTLMFYFWMLAGVMVVLWRKYYLKGSFIVR